VPPGAQDRVAGLAFTEHLDITGWAIGQEDLLNHLRPLVDANGVLTPELLDAGGYLDCIERCRWKFPELRILTGVELGQPHIDGDGARRLVDLSALDRVNGSLHTLPVPEAPEALRCEPITLYRRWPAERVVRDYLAEVHRVISGSDAFAVFTHIEYAVRDWPTHTEGPFDPRTFEDEFRQAMRAVAGSGRARAERWRPDTTMDRSVVERGRWPRHHVGQRCSHPEGLAGNFFEAMAMAEYFGFRPGRRPEDVWTRA